MNLEALDIIKALAAYYSVPVATMDDAIQNAVDQYRGK